MKKLQAACVIACIILLSCGDNDTITSSDLTPLIDNVEQLQNDIDALKHEIKTLKHDHPASITSSSEPPDEKRPTIPITPLPRPEPQPLPEVIDKVPTTLGEGIITYEGNGGIHIMNPDGSDDTFVVALGKRPRLSPDRRFIVYAVAENDSLHVVRIDGIHVTTLIKESVASEPAWSHDGTNIAFSNGRINIMNSDGTNIVQVTQDHHPFIRHHEPCWSPDGRYIAFSAESESETRKNIYAISIDGVDVHQLTNEPSDEESPDWSPNGRQITYMRHAQKNWNIYVVEVNAPIQKRQITDSFGSDRHPAWSPDGRSIVFSSSRHSSWKHTQFELYMVNADGTNMQQLTEHIKDAGGDLHPNWR